MAELNYGDQQHLGGDKSTAVRQVLDRARADGRNALTAPEGKLVCDAYGIAVPKEGVASSSGNAVSLANAMGFPVVLKIVSPDILHKTEAGGVLVGLNSADEVARGYDTILANAKKYKSDAKIDGVQIQQMLTAGQEVITRAVADGSFGKLVSFGLGGTLLDLFLRLFFFQSFGDLIDLGFRLLLRLGLGRLWLGLWLILLARSLMGNW